MPQSRKIATCCYCGTRAILVLDQTRHELACSACGAPLHEMKLMPTPAARHKERAAPRFDPRAPKPQKKVSAPQKAYSKGYRNKKRRKGKSISKKIFEEIWDVVEDIFD